MNRMGLGVITGVLISLQLFGCTSMIHKLITGDRNHDVSSMNNENISKIVSGKTTEEELIQLLGTEPGGQFSFDTPLPKEYEGKKYQIDKLVRFYWYTAEHIQHNKYITHRWKEQLDLTLFLTKDIVQFYYVSHVLRDKNGKFIAG